VDLNNLKVELIPHVAKQGVQMGNQTVIVDVPFKQCFVQCNGPRVGIYCGLANEPNKVLTFTEQNLPLPLQEAIAKKVAELTGGVKSFNAPPPEEHEVTSGDE